MVRRRVKRNRAGCPECGDVVESKHVHDHVSCSCGGIFVDGGLEYLRRGYRTHPPVELATQRGLAKWNRAHGPKADPVVAQWPPCPTLASPAWSSPEVMEVYERGQQRARRRAAMARCLSNDVDLLDRSYPGSEEQLAGVLEGLAAEVRRRAEERKRSARSGR